jgi:hypothetical protein
MFQSYSLFYREGLFFPWFNSNFMYFNEPFFYHLFLSIVDGSHIFSMVPCAFEHFGLWLALVGLINLTL